VDDDVIANVFSLDREGPQLKISVQDTDMTVVSGTAV
jgi:hypothetical protein